MSKRRSFWGWGHDGEGPDPQALAAAEAGLRGFLGIEELVAQAPPQLEQIDLPPPRIEPPQDPRLRALLTTDRYERARHCYGRSYRDLVRALAGDFRVAPDLVAYPESEEDVAELLGFCAGARLAVIPFGGGTSVCGGVEADVGPRFRGALSLDLERLGRVREVDPISRTARIEAGALGPDLEAALRPHGLSLRHYPQSFAFSTLGGWIATRSGGHFATLQTHIDELVESLRLVTPRGTLATRRLPASGAGPAPERLFIGSEGTLGVITEAWVRLSQRPRFRASATLGFADFLGGAGFVRAIAQAGLYPANLRLLDPLEALLNGAGAGQAIALVSFESGEHPLGPWLERALACARDHGATVLNQSQREEGEPRGAGAPTGEGPAERWRAAFLRGPYLRDALVQRGMLIETFETAVTWERFPALYQAVKEATEGALREVCGKGLLSCRLTHAYPDGVAPYFTVIAPARRGAELAMWGAIKEIATTTLLAEGGTTTHHHAVGRDFRPYYERERDPLFGSALLAVKRALDPDGLLNPGVLLPAP
jgi:alkyldihydroxyacetonephosphate synthase